MQIFVYNLKERGKKRKTNENNFKEDQKISNTNLIKHNN